MQTLYKFINDVVIFETEIVDKTARSIAKNRFAVAFPFACRYDAMTVVVDEDYHALVAMDFMQQTVAMTGITPIELPDEIELSRAIPAAVALAPEHLRSAVELICVAIAENTVTGDVAAFAKDDTVKQSIKGLMADHLLDEGRHSGFWARMVRIYWHTASEDDRQMHRAHPAGVHRPLPDQRHPEVLRLAPDRVLADQRCAHAAHSRAKSRGWPSRSIAITRWSPTSCGFSAAVRCSIRRACKTP